MVKYCNHTGISSMDQIRLLVYLLYAIAGSTSNIFDIECKYGGMKVKLCRLRLFLQQRATPCNIFVSDENSKLVLFFGGDQSLTFPSNSNFLFGLHFFIPLVLSSVFPLRVGFFHENWPFSPQMMVYISCLTHFAFTSLATFLLRFVLCFVMKSM